MFAVVIFGKGQVFGGGDKCATLVKRAWRRVRDKQRL